MRRVARRYELEAVIGRGAHGEVWRGRDALADRPVAVKIISGDFAAARVRREVAALRLLRLPGVVGMVDEGIDDGAPFVVMDLVEGAAFPGAHVPARWSDVEEATLSLLEVLSRVHAAGVVHRDLKPSNVLVDGEQRVTLLDFGLCNGSVRDDGDDEDAIVGTPAFLAPEQIRGETPTAATDLYALGLLLHHALVGRLPHPTDDLATLTRARLSTKAPRLRDLAPEVPSVVSDVVDALLAVEPADRPQSAAEVVARLRGAAHASRRDAIVAAVSRALQDSSKGLEGLFAGPDRLLHLREDGAALLRSRVGGELDPTRITYEIVAWIGSGLARWDGERLHVDRAALERLAAIPRTTVEGASRARRRAAHRTLAEAMPPGEPGRLMHLVAADAQESIVDEAMLVARAQAERGRLESAAFVLDEASRALRSDHDAFPLLCLWTEIALVEGAPRSMDRVLYAVCRRTGPAEKLARIESLLRAALAVGTWTERALAMVEAIPPFDEPALERRRQGVRVFAAVRSSLETEEKVLEEIARWAASRSKEDRACLAGWMGRLRYRQGRFVEAAKLHDEAARTERWATRRIAARINAASAWMEAFELEEAERQAEEGRALAAECRDGFFEGYAEWTLRAIAVRRDRAGRPDHELVDVAKTFGRNLEAAILLTEAAAAYRANQLADALKLAKQAREAWLAVGDPSALLFADAICVACGDDSREVPEMIASAQNRTSSGIGLQVLALITRGGHRIDCDRAEIDLLANAIPREHWHIPMDVLSVDESLKLLGANEG